jgi:hypothetical protein
MSLLSHAPPQSGSGNTKAQFFTNLLELDSDAQLALPPGKDLQNLGELRCT